VEKQTQRLIRAPQAANLLDLRLPRLYELARRNLIPGLVRIGDKALRFDLLALERFISPAACAKTRPSKITKSRQMNEWQTRGQSMGFWPCSASKTPRGGNGRHCERRWHESLSECCVLRLALEQGIATHTRPMALSLLWAFAVQHRKTDFGWCRELPCSSISAPYLSSQCLRTRDHATASTPGFKPEGEVRLPQPP
jgi:predicted DNA-binding transcriptional regulator AlpA